MPVLDLGTNLSQTLFICSRASLEHKNLRIPLEHKGPCDLSLLVTRNSEVKAENHEAVFGLEKYGLDFKRWHQVFVLENIQH